MSTRTTTAAFGALVLALAIIAGACGTEASLNTIGSATEAEPTPKAAATVSETDSGTLTGVISLGAIGGDIIDGGAADLPDDANVWVSVEDVSYADAASITLMERSYTGVDLPLSYELDWVDGLDERNDFAMRVRVESPDGTLLYTNDTRFSLSPNQATMDFHIIAVNG